MADFNRSLDTTGMIWSEAQSTYAAARDLVSGTLYAGDFRIGQGSGGASNYYVYRAPMTFDTSSIPDDATVLSASLNLYITQIFGSTAWSMTVQSGAPTYPHYPAQSGDFDRTNYSGDGGSKTAASSSKDAWNAITLNSTGISLINTNGYTKFMLRSSKDIAGTAPSVGASESVRGTTTGNVPYLSITWREPISGAVSITAVPAISPQAEATYSARATISNTVILFATWANLVQAEVAIQAIAQMIAEGIVVDWDLLFEYAGTLTAGQILVLDCDRQLLTVDGVNDVKNMTGDWIKLAIGDNEIEITFTGDSIDADVEYQERWA